MNICEQLKLENDRLVIFKNIPKGLISHIIESNGLYIEIPGSLIVYTKEKMFFIQKGDQIEYRDACPPGIKHILKYSMTLDRIRRFAWNCAFWAMVYAATDASDSDAADAYASAVSAYAASDASAHASASADAAADAAAYAAASAVSAHAYAYASATAARLKERNRQSQYIKRLQKGQLREERSVK